MMTPGAGQQGPRLPAPPALRMPPTSRLAAATSAQPGGMAWTSGLPQLLGPSLGKASATLPWMPAPLVKPTSHPCLLSCLRLDLRCASSRSQAPGHVIPTFCASCNTCAEATHRGITIRSVMPHIAAQVVSFSLQWTGGGL